MTTRIQDRVLRVIHSNPGVEDDDKQLLAAVWREEGWNDSLTLLDNLKRVSNPETVTRARRKLHELGLIEYSDEADLSYRTLSKILPNRIKQVDSYVDALLELLSNMDNFGE